MSEQQTARSYKGAILDDNAIISINLRWLFQVFVLVAGLVYSYIQVVQRITDLEREYGTINDRVVALESKHDAEMKELEAWYKKSLDINPLNIFGKPKRK
jgi:hypothetical protein|tara:strand:+ start:106 stop:405 length:300 start_codon:yes stop_codon:yes gene_type:complete